MDPNRVKATIREFTDRNVQALDGAAIQLACDNAEVDLETYAYFLKQFYVYVRATTTSIRSAYETLPVDHPLREELHHAVMDEHGHDRMLLNDLAAAGVTFDPADTDRIAVPAALAMEQFHLLAGKRGLLPLTAFRVALEAYSFRYSDPTADGAKKALGIPENAVIFMREHGSLDGEHVEEGVNLLVSLIKTEDDLREALMWLETEFALFRAFLNQVWNGSPMGKRKPVGIAA